MVTGTGAVNRDGKNLEQRKFIQDLRVQISYSNWLSDLFEGKKDGIR